LILAVCRLSVPATLQLPLLAPAQYRFALGRLVFRPRFAPSRRSPAGRRSCFRYLAHRLAGSLGTVILQRPLVTPQMRRQWFAANFPRSHDVGRQFHVRLLGRRFFVYRTWQRP
jgi:hypothetical protein